MSLKPAVSSFKKNMLLALGAQAVALGVGLIKSLVLPAAMSVEGFAYWQVYVLYSGFVGVCAFGYTDGVYLLYGGYDYKDLPLERLRGANRVYCLFLAVLSIALGCFAMLGDDGLRSFAFAFVALDVFVLCMSGLCTYVLQVTNQFKRYSFCTVVDKVIFLAAAVCMAAAGLADFRLYVVVDAATKVVALACFGWFCRGVLFGRASALATSSREALTYARTGISLMLANFSGMLISNLGRFIIDWLGDLASYAFYSFGNSVTNLVLTFVTAVSSVLYPKLKRVSDGDLGSYFLRIDKAMLPIASAGLLLYFPALWFVGAFYARYAPMLAYLNVMFVSAVYQARISILVNTFYKTLRMERRMLLANVQCVTAFALMAGVSFWLTRDVWWIAASTAATAALRCVLSEREIRQRLGVRDLRPAVVQGTLATGFFAFTFFLPTITALCAYVCLAVVCGVWALAQKRKAVC